MGTQQPHYGKENEQVAYTWVESCGFSLESRGTLVSVKEKWLSANPDGELNSQGLE